MCIFPQKIKTVTLIIIISVPSSSSSSFNKVSVANNSSSSANGSTWGSAMVSVRAAEERPSQTFFLLLFLFSVLHSVEAGFCFEEGDLPLRNSSLHSSVLLGGRWWVSRQRQQWPNRDILCVRVCVSLRVCVSVHTHTSRKVWKCASTE